MLAVIAAILFAVAFVLHGAGPAHIPVWFNWDGLLLLGLVSLALHAAGVGVGPNWPRRG